MVRGVRVGNLVVEEPGKNEGDAGAACAANVGEYGLEGGHCHGDDVGQDDDDSGDGREAGFAHTVV